MKMQPHNAIPPLTQQQKYDLLLAEYLDLLDEQTGYNFTNKQLIEHTVNLSYKELRQRYTDLTLGRVRM
jgi:hypothetical protein